MKVEIVKFTTEHANKILKTNKEIHLFTKDYVDAAVRFYQHEANRAYTLLADGEPIMCGGIVDQGGGNGEAWVLLSNDFYKYKVLCHRTLKKMFLVMVKDMNLKRVQALMDFDMGSKTNHKWLQSFGLHPEGLSRNLGINGEDYFRYARTF